MLETIFISLLWTAAVLYCALFLVYIFGYLKAEKQAAVPPCGEHRPHVSVVIAARNEEHGIAACLESLLNQTYPKSLLEIIVVDDDSEDATAAIVAGFAAQGVRLLSLKDRPVAGMAHKKAAISLAVEAARGSLIVATDADCIFPKEHIAAMSAFYMHYAPKMIVMPVRFATGYTLLDVFQQLDFMCMQGVTAATVALNLGAMSNGANLAFSKEVFSEMGGYGGVDHIISGDDYLLQLKIRSRYPEGVRYFLSEDAIVDTVPPSSWRAFFGQRIRWASKTGKYEDPLITTILLFVWLFNVLLLSGLVASMFMPQLRMPLLAIFALKICSELLLLLPASVFYRRLQYLIFFPVLQPLHTLYIASAALLSRFGTFRWKNRKLHQQ